MTEDMVTPAERLHQVLFANRCFAVYLLSIISCVTMSSVVAEFTDELNNIVLLKEITVFSLFAF